MVETIPLPWVASDTAAAIILLTLSETPFSDCVDFISSGMNLLTKAIRPLPKKMTIKRIIKTVVSPTTNNNKPN